MSELSRRQFLKSGLASSLLLFNGCSLWPQRSTAKAHVIIVGGGFGGATAAKYLRLFSPNLKITLIEPKSRYLACPGSNGVFAGITTLEQLSTDYQRLRQRHQINVISDSVSSIKPQQRQVELSGGNRLSYDRLILSPGIAFRWDTIDGYSQSLSEQFPHAWQAGQQTLLLNDQLQNLPDNGTVLICPPADPYRCPPGPYERASLMAYWLKRHKPRAKILILDPKRSFSKQTLFESGWKQHYGYGTANSLIEWHSLADNPIVALDAAGKTVITAFGDRCRGDVINLIPPQTAGSIALESGLADQSGWCPVNPISSESSISRFIHVIGDAAYFNPIPKSAFAANSEAKMCALALSCLFNETELPSPRWINTCYSLITADQAVSVSHSYRLSEAQSLAKAQISGGISSKTDRESLALEAGYAQAAYRQLLEDSFY